ncbi:hypothetical protein SISNIDRAFT_416396 [Sistotremastrum niveocremeum HHB9708]|uniref:Zn(2)-C6 fungal-type domain-containing protein n=1 Tax=Sistotremastrum niveocremeum HHB9708 TaxID=1314777 RepID=A0A164QUB8_9AGAM|nr:hypothetical protein SISNIDRAFT_416396 [Sistotremastrum niveocremeum HHB9708]
MSGFNEYHWPQQFHPQHPQHAPHPPPQPQQHNPQQLTIDPALAPWESYYPYQPQLPQSQQQPLAPPQHSDSPSEGSESPSSQVEPSPKTSNPNGKRPATSQPSASSSRKKPRKSAVDDDQGPTDSLSPGEKEEVKAKPTRGSRACTVCRRLKMKCEGAENGPPCKRCLSGNHDCVFEESNRGKRTSKCHELLTRSLRKMERTLDTVLRSISNPGLNITSGMVSRSPSPSTQTATTQALLASPSPPPPPSAHKPHGSPKLHSLPDNSLNPLGLLAEASLANRKAIKAISRPSSGKAGSSNPESASSGKVGVANDGYFKPGPMTILPLRRLYIERQVQPEMLSFVTKEETLELFKIYFQHLNPQCNLLVASLHTPSLVCSRSPFLLTTICAIASKFYTPNPDLHNRLDSLAKSLAWSVPQRGYKSLEIVQAYLLLTLWGCGHAERYEQEKTWLLLGMGIRMATDLNLHRKTAVTSLDTPEGLARDQEVHNRERTWLMCFILDRSISAQMGKPHSIKEDYIIRNSQSWWQHPAAVPADSGIAAYVELQRILSRSLDFLYSGTSSASGLQTDCDYLLVIKTIETQILAWNNEWVTYRRFASSTFYENTEYRKAIGKFYFNYTMLVINSFGLQNALERSNVDIGHFFARCHSSATACATLARDILGPLGYLRYSPDSTFVQCSYAVLTLLKLVRPEFQSFMESEAKTISLVKDIADLLEAVAATPQHTPALYSAFLRALISAKTESSRGVSPKLGATENLSGTPTFSANHSDGINMQATQESALNPRNFSGRNYILSDFQFTGEMGPVADISTFPPTMVPAVDIESPDMLSMDSVLSAGFWDSVLVPGYSNTLEGLSGGVVYGAGGSGLITPRLGTPIVSSSGTPLVQATDLLPPHAQMPKA